MFKENTKQLREWLYMVLIYFFARQYCIDIGRYNLMYHETKKEKIYIEDLLARMKSNVGCANQF